MKAAIILIALAIPANAYVYIDAPSQVVVGSEFYLYINANVSSFDSANYTITFSKDIEVLEIMEGRIGNFTIPVNGSVVKNQSISIVQNIGGVGNVSGTGYLSIIRVRALNEGAINFEINGTMADANGKEINSTWNGCQVEAYLTILKIDCKSEASVNETIDVNLSICNAENIDAINFVVDYTHLLFQNASSTFNLSFIQNNGSIKGVVILGNKSGNITIATFSMRCVNPGMAYVGIKNFTISNVYAEEIGAYRMNATIFISSGNPPYANFTWHPLNPVEGETVYFNSTSYDSDGYIVNYTWQFGDGSTAYGSNVSHVYGSQGTYNVTLTIEDNGGLSSYTTKNIVVWNRWDINMDGHVNVLDLILVAQHWGEYGEKGWIREDVNRDGMINVLDMISVAQHWG